ncbi:MAG: phage major tail tube protein [Pseudomonadota bacterium]
MPYPRTIRNFNAFVDGRSYAGLCTQATLPEIALNTEDFRGGGMDMPIPIDMGMAAMTAELQFKEWSSDLMTRVGGNTRLVLRAGEMGQDDFEASALVFTIGGRVIATPMGDLGTGQDALLTLRWGVDYFRVARDGDVLVEIDAENAVRIIDGVDQLAGMRRAMGI